MNCRWIGWHVGIGLGIRCWNPENRAIPHPDLRYNGPAPLIPNREFVCKQFDLRPICEDASPSDGTEIDAPAKEHDNAIHASIHSSDRNIGRK
jgi:hypothetical protein